MHMTCEDSSQNGKAELDVTNNNENARRKWKSSMPQVLIYASQFLSSWGDRMWMFAGGLFLIEISPESFRLVAIYESALSLTVIIFGAIVGRWIDRTPRLLAAQLSLFVQNLMVCLCTILLCFLVTYKEFFLTALNGWAKPLGEATAIIMACVAQIGTLGIKLAIEKDWIVVICAKDDTKLSKMNSVLRSIDLSTEMMAPVLVGFVMAGYGMVPGGILIAVWNVASFGVEYGTLHYLYKALPELQKAKVFKEGENEKKENLLEKMQKSAAVWKTYFRHHVRNAGLALAVLFVTCLQLDNYSRAYVYTTGVTTGALGILTAAASFSGIVGSVCYPTLRKKVGVLRTGLIGLGTESTFLILCVAAIFAPGTLFRPSYLWDPPVTENSTAVAVLALNSSVGDSYTIADISTTSASILAEDIDVYNSSVNSFPGNDTNSAMSPSVSLLLSGMILSRFGLWLADLSVTQILQEEVAEGERGAINGVQYSLNQSFNLLRHVILIVLPSMETFGYLVILSFLFVLLGFFLFLSYAMKASKRLIYEVEDAMGRDNKMFDVPL